MSKIPDYIELLCIGCDKKPAEIDEYSFDFVRESSGDPEITPDQYVWDEEGTLNRENGHFLCTTCYINAGMPSSPRGREAP